MGKKWVLHPPGEEEREGRQETETRIRSDERLLFGESSKLGGKMI